MITLRPSASYKWVNCPASPRFEASVPEEPESDEAREGTCAAWVVETVLCGDAHSADDMLGETHLNGWLVTPDMVQHCQGFINMVRARGGNVWPERNVMLWNNSEGQIVGRLDVMSNIDHQGVLHVDDLKYGMMIVEPFQNTQLLIYAAAVWAITPDRPHTIQLGIYQPRAFHPAGIYRTWVVSADELVQWANWIISRGKLALDPNSVATPGDHCRNGRCRAASTCTAIAHTIYAQQHLVTSPVQQTMTGEELSKELTFLHRLERLLKARKSAVETEAETRIKTKAEFVPGWQLQQRFGNRKLKVPPMVAEALTGVPATEQKERTPAAMERDGAPIDVMKTLTETPSIGFKLKPLDPSKIAQQFEKE
jgi:hypothetical protein